MIRPTVATVSVDAVQANLRTIQTMLARETGGPHLQGPSAVPPGVIAVV